MDTLLSATTTSENSDTENDTDELKRPERTKRLLARQNNVLSDVEMTSASESESSAYKFGQGKRKGQKSKKSSARRTKKTIEECISDTESVRYMLGVCSCLSLICFELEVHIYKF